MTPERFLHLLENDPTQLPFSEEVVSTLRENLAITQKFVDLRTNFRHKDRFSVGKQLADFAKTTNLPLTTVKSICHLANLKTKKTQKTIDREKSAIEAHIRRLAVLNAVCLYVGGDVSAAQAARRNNIQTAVVYKAVKRYALPPPEHLGRLSAHRRKELAKALRKDQFPKLQEQLTKQLSVREDD